MCWYITQSFFESEYCKKRCRQIELVAVRGMQFDLISERKLLSKHIEKGYSTWFIV